jgi:hypothetical protein
MSDKFNTCIAHACIVCWRLEVTCPPVAMIRSREDIVTQLHLLLIVCLRYLLTIYKLLFTNYILTSILDISSVFNINKDWLERY